MNIKNKKCKIMFFVYILGRGGAERMILNILNNIDYSKYEVYLTLGQKEGNEYLKLLNKNSKVILNNLDVPLGDNNLCSDRLAKLLDDNNIDILFTEAHFTNMLAYNARKKQKNKKVKLIFREATCYSRVETKTIKNRMRVFTRYNFAASKIIAISEGVKEDLSKNYKVKKNKIVTVYNPIDLEYVTKMSKLPIEDKIFNKIKGKKIINVARLEYAKQQKVLLEAFKIAQNKLKEPVSLILLGRGSMEQELKDYVKTENIQNVYFLGFKENPFQYMKKCDLFVLSSRSEGFGNVITESMSVGTPVVSTSCPSGPSEILKDGEYGELVDVGDVENLSKKIVNILENNTKRKKLINKGLERVKDFNVKYIVKQYEKVIDDVYNGR